MSAWDSLVYSSSLYSVKNSFLPILKDHIDKEIKWLTKGGRGRVDAVRFVRDFVDSPLMQARDYVLKVVEGKDRERQQAIISTEEYDEIVYQMSMGRKIHAIKFCREVTGWGLREAKDYVDRIDDGFIGRPCEVQDWIPEEMWNVEP